MYGIDTRLPGILYAVVARPQVLGGRVVRYDATATLKVPAGPRRFEVSSSGTTKVSEFEILNGSRKKRVASGSGTSVAEINRLIKQYQEMRRMMKTARKGMRGLDMSKMAFPGPKSGGA